MNLYILDTDVLTLYQEGHAAITARLLLESPKNVAITVLSVEEQLSGWYTQARKAKTPDRLAWAYHRLAGSVSFLSGMPIQEYDEKAIERYKQLHALKINIGAFDLRIAAIALENSAIIVTRNVSDFGRVPGLTIEDWSV